MVMPKLRNLYYVVDVNEDWFIKGMLNDYEESFTGEDNRLLTNKIWVEVVLRYMACLIICIIQRTYSIMQLLQVFLVSV